MHKRLTYITFLTLMLLQMLSCNPAVEPVVSEQFQVNDSLLKRLLIDTVQQANTASELNFSARIIPDEDKRAAIYPMVSGTVQNVPVMIGDYVKKGQQLASIASAEMAGYEKEVIAAEAELATSTRNLTQTESLYSSGLSSGKELEEAKNEVRVKQAELARANSILKLNGGNRSGRYRITSPIAGFIVEKNINSNMQLRPDNDQAIFTVADLSQVSALINIYESDIPKIAEGDEVSISLLSYPDRSFSGRIDKIFSVLDADSKVINARVSLSNPDLILKPGMLATAKIQSRSGVNLPVVNSRGIIFDDNRNFVLLVDNSSKVKIQEVKLSRQNAGRAYIAEGLAAGDRIIASKQVFIYESLKN
jgi:cobalt-zinc-cadmium efflux system membrane fusion protein